MAYIERSAIWLAKQEATYADPATTFSYATDTVELINPTIDGDNELIAREIMVNSLVAAKPVLGKQTSSGSFSLEATGIDGTGKLNGSLFYKAGLGFEIPAVVTTVGSAATTTTVTVPIGEGANYAVGQAIMIGYSTITDDEYVVIRSIAGDVLTFSPALVGTPAAVDQVVGLLSYVIPKPTEPTISLAMQEYISDGTTPIEYTYRGLVVSDLTINYPVGNVVKTDFSVAGAGFGVASGVAPQVPVCFGLTPYIAKNMTFSYNNVAYDVADLSIKVSSDVTDTMAITTDGITNKTIVAKSAVGGSFSLDYAGVALYNAYIANTTGELFGTVTSIAGKVHGVYMPSVMISKDSKSKDAGLYKDNIDFTALSSGLDCSTEDALTVFFS